MSLPDMLLLFFFPALMAYSAVSDMLTMTISNRVSLLLIAGFMVMVGLAGMEWSAIGMHLAAGMLVLAITFTMFALGWMGGGDAKLAAATGLWCGFGALLEYGLLVSVFGGFLTLFILYCRSFILPVSIQQVPWIARLHHQKTGIPYGIALAAAGLAVYPSTAIWGQFASL